MIKINKGCSFLHPLTGAMIHPGQTYEDNPTPVAATIDLPVEDKSADETAITEEKLSSDQFLALGADEQKQRLVAAGLASTVDDEAISNKDKRAALYQQYLEAGQNDGEGSEDTPTATE